EVADGAPWRKTRHVLRDVRPRFPAVARHLHEAVVGADPNHARLFRRFGNRVDDVGVLDTDVVRRQPAGALLPALVVQREIRTDLLPALTAFGRLMQVLAADLP